MAANANSMPRHVGPNVLPNHNIFSRLLGYGAQGDGIAINDVTNGYAATHLQLLTDALHVRNVLYDSLEEKTRQRLWKGEEVFFNLLGPASYEYAIGFFAILAIGGVIVPLCASSSISPKSILITPAPALPVQEATYYVNTCRGEALLTSSQCLTLGNDLAHTISTTTNPK